MTRKMTLGGTADEYVYFGPSAPNFFEKNWIPTVAGKAWFPYFRLYGPSEALLLDVRTRSYSPLTI
jgi:hypothetical protein